MNVLLAESQAPPLRQVIGALLGAATTADIAVSHIRLAAIDLAPGETAGLARCRILLRRLDAQQLADFGRGPAATRRHLATLLHFITSPRVEIRSAALASWTPDFSIYAGLPGAHGEACLVGAHYFHQPVVDGGPSFTCLLTDAAAVRLASARFAELWEQAHDVLPAVVAEIERGLHAPAPR